MLNMHVTLQFHPDWVFGDDLVIEAIARDGRYRSQFETGTSNGGLTAYEGGDRWRWESRLFIGRYDGAADSERPVYGALNFADDSYGGSVRFGSAYLRLSEDAVSRCTFCFPDSVFEPKAVTGWDGVEDLIRLARASELDSLDRYVEAHVHGQVSIGRDVEALVLDPCYRGTDVESAAGRLDCRVEWHPGFSTATASLDRNYRGAEHVELARSMGSVLTPDLIGQAARSREYDGQALKKVWHYLARFGKQA
ncbi:DUF3626 domain-containing protein [Ornithinimicrobium sp. Y1694]|uniref:DUF3626 domain-containing protein n=1 Tax=Ornithinimicrobium sp. Y1694 TaxID=3418590 RepID=UPI003CF17A09